MEKKKKDPPITKKLIEKWQQQVAEERFKLFANLRFDKWGRLIKDEI